MSRLIDASVFEVVCFQGKSEEFCEGAKYILEMIDAQPTAYDISKVVAKMEKEREITRLNTMGYPKTIWEDAIDIVKRGGVE